MIPSRAVAALAFPLFGAFVAPAPAADPVPVNRPELPPLPKAVSSLGAVACDGYLYVYGGHAGKTHSYDTTTALGTFHRLKLDGGTRWEELPGGPKAQGVGLAAHGGMVYRVGGMQPRNAPGTAADNHSLADCARFDPKVGKWQALPPLPDGRSSHEAVVAGDKLVVVGGWEMKGEGADSAWADTALVLDLAVAKPEWKSIPQPFKRRALAAAAVGNKVYVLGGLGADGGDRRVDVLDVAAEKWTTGPALPGSDRVAFAPAACAVGGRLVANTSEGPVYRLTAAGDGWEKVGAAATKRVVARLVPLGTNAVVLVGGSGGGANVAAVEVVRVSDPAKPVTPAEAAKKVNEQVLVEMEVKSTGGKDVCFLNSEADFKGDQNFTVFIPAAALEAFKAAKIDDPRTYYKGKTVRVTGTVTLYREKPQIKVELPAQVEVVGKK
jgi:N-acetylneuraminic acid mutarotase